MGVTDYRGELLPPGPQQALLAHANSI
jgi:hypothetical protein